MGFSNVHGIPGLPGVTRQARILAGRAAAAEVCERVAAQVSDRHAAGEAAPSLATIVVGESPAAAAFVAATDAACSRTGVSFSLHRFGADVSEEKLGACIDVRNDDSTVSGILLQLPLPAGLDPRPFLERIDPRKDVDGLHLADPGRLAEHGALPPATAKGISCPARPPWDRAGGPPRCGNRSLGAGREAGRGAPQPSRQHRDGVPHTNPRP